MLSRIRRLSGLPAAIAAAGALVGAIGAVIVFGPEGIDYRIGAAVASVGFTVLG